MATKNMKFGNNTTTVNVEATGTVVGTNIKSKGSATQPVYFDANGVAQPINKNETANSLLNELGIGNSVPADTDYYISQYAGGGTTNTTYLRRPLSYLWDYIKNKINSVLGLDASAYSGKAASAGDADTVGGHTVGVNVPANAKFTDTTYSSKAAASGGTDVSLVTTGEKHTWNNKQNAINASNKLAASNVSGLATVATTGSYTDLTNKPTIPTVTDTYSSTSSNGMSGKAVASALSSYVAKDGGKVLSTNDFTTDLKNKLNGIAAGAEVNVQSDWNQTTTTADDYIKNKPTLGTAASKAVDTSISSGSSSGNLPTSSAVASFVEGQHYTEKDLVPVLSKTYASTSYYGSANDANNASWYFGSVKPEAWYKPWSIKLRIRSFCPTHANVDSVTLSTISGRSTDIIYHNWNERQDTAHMYLNVYRLNSTGFNAGYGHAIGIGLRSSTNPTSSGYYRTFQVDILSYENCTFTILDTPVKWASWTGTGTTNYTGLSEIDAYNRGLRETGDDNNIDRYCLPAGYMINGGNFRCPPNSLAGTDRNNKIQALSLYSSEYTGTTTAVNTARVYNAIGIDYKKNIMYMSTGTNFAKNANIDISPYLGMGYCDLRYSDNCIYSHNGSNFDLKPRKYIYLRGVIKEDGLFYLRPFDATHIIVQGYYKNANTFVTTSGGSTNISSYTPLNINFVYQDITSKKYYSWNGSTYAETTNYSTKQKYQKAWTQDIPTTESYDSAGYQHVYMLLGIPVYSGSYINGQYQFSLYMENPVYWFKDGAFKIYNRDDVRKIVSSTQPHGQFEHETWLQPY